MKRNSYSFRIHLTSALIVCAMAMLFVSSHLLASRATSAQDPNATLPAKEKTAPAKKTAPPPKKSSPRKRTSSGNASADEIAFWASIKDSTNPEDFKAYLQQYPNGRFVSLARNRLTALEAAAKEDAARKEDAKRKEDEAKRRRPGVITKNSIGMEFVWIPAGSFLMGSEDNYKPVHLVTLSSGFYMGRFEVTQGQWQEVMNYNPSYFKECGANCPVEQVSWNGAQQFIGELNARNDGFRYRLASSAEWEYACRAGTTGEFAGELDTIAWYKKNSGETTHPVGQKKPNAFGVYDLVGNVGEWCQDVYHESYVGAPVDGTAWLKGLPGPLSRGDKTMRIVRNASAMDIDYHLRSASAFGSYPDYVSRATGFRVVMVSKP